MLSKTSPIFAGILAFCSLSAVTVIPVMAKPINNSQTSEFTISQLRGHELYRKGPQLNPSDYIIGNVVGQAGDVVTVQLPDGTIFDTSSASDQWGAGQYNYFGGMNVRVVKLDNAYSLVGPAHPRWIIDLQEKYGLKY